MKTSLAALILASLVVGCASDPRSVSVDIQSMSTTEKVAYARVKLLIPTQLQGRSIDVLGLAEGHSCQSTMWSPEASEELALEQVKVMASRKGADGVTDLQCYRAASAMCWSAVTCTAKALKFGS